MSAEMAHIPTGGHMPPPTPAERYTGHDLCVCSHYRASHTPIENIGGGPCFDPEYDDCRCRGFTADLPRRRK